MAANALLRLCALIRDAGSGAAATGASGINAVIQPLKATLNGALPSIAEVGLHARHFCSQPDGIDGLVICLPNLGDKIAVVELVHRARLTVPILLHASKDEVAKLDVKSRRDAFCGKISVTNNFWQFGIAFSETTNHASDIWGDEFGGDLDRFTRVCRRVRGLRGAWRGTIGARTGAQ